jgi:acetylornithine deacetylase/succinyl-diaminopimelate desuccinylase-like protein
MVAMLAAGLSVKEKDLKKPLLVMGTYGEESGMGGARLFTRKWKGAKPCLAIAGEPTNLEITYRHKGIGVVGLELHTTQSMSGSPKTSKTIRFKGIQGHSSRPWLGDNALEKAARYLLADKKGALRVTDLSGGHAANIIPGEASLSVCARAANTPKTPGVPCFSSRAVAAPWLAAQKVLKRYSRKDRTFKPSMMTSNFGIARVKGPVLSMTFDFRLLPGQDAPVVFRTFKKHLLEELRACPGIRLKMWLERDNPPLDQLLSDPLPRLAKKWLHQNHLPQKLTVKPACTEGGFYDVWGVPAVIFGPGESARNIHAPNECVSIRQIEKAAEFYKSVIREVCILGRS